ncbi:MFS transporter [Ferrovum sp.]|uniref:MFS transporter n=1 Tax=Ferrovum sp. TaxID=2609467 RepID=UPI00262957EC|nr:MFS transporter [Ferrovum sp.]
MQTTGNSTVRVLIASLAGTTIEFFDFYIYATAAVLVFPKLFFPSSDPTSALLQSFATFALAFFARPVGAILFGHFGDRIGRKATLVASLMTMGPSTVAIGLLPTYHSIGVAAPILLAIFRFGQGLGLGGEWGGAILLATENAPPHKKTWYGMFPQLGAPLGFILSSGTFLGLSRFLPEEDFLTYGWRIPFIASALLIGIGLYVRLKLTETPVFMKVVAQHQQVTLPMRTIFTQHGRALLLGTLSALALFVLFYLMTVFTLSWGTTALHYPKSDFLHAQLIGILFFALGIPLSALMADRFGRSPVLLWVSVAIFLFGLAFGHLFKAGHWGNTVMFLSLGLFLMGGTYGPMGTTLAELFPPPVRYTGASLSFTLAGILGASLAPYIATFLAKQWGLDFVGYYLCAAATLTLFALWTARTLMREPS